MRTGRKSNFPALASLLIGFVLVGLAANAAVYYRHRSLPTPGVVASKLVAGTTGVFAVLVVGSYVGAPLAIMLGEMGRRRARGAGPGEGGAWMASCGVVMSLVVLVPTTVLHVSWKRQSKRYEAQAKQQDQRMWPKFQAERRVADVVRMLSDYAREHCRQFPETLAELDEWDTATPAQFRPKWDEFAYAGAGLNDTSVDTMGEISGAPGVVLVVLKAPLADASRVVGFLRPSARSSGVMTVAGNELDRHLNRNDERRARLGLPGVAREIRASLGLPATPLADVN